MKKRNLSYLLKLSIIAMVVLQSAAVKAQEAPPRPISIYANAADGLVFGAFFQGPSGGTVTIHPNGTRTVTGDVGEVNMGYPYTAAIFQVDAAPGTIISILTGPDAVLNGSNGGSMQLSIADTDPDLPYITTVTPPALTEIRVGGTLTVGPAAANPPGIYSGTFFITFIQE